MTGRARNDVDDDATQTETLPTVDADGSGSHMIVADSVVITAPQWSPDGSEILYQTNVSTTPGIIACAIADLRTGTKRIVVRDAMDPHW